MKLLVFLCVLHNAICIRMRRARAITIDKINRQFNEEGLFVKKLMIPAGGSSNPVSESKGPAAAGLYDRTLGGLFNIRYGKQPEEEGLFAGPVKGRLESWRKQTPAEGEWYSSSTFVGGPLLPKAEPAGTDLFQCNPHGCAFQGNWYPVLPVYSPRSVIGCAYASNGGTNSDPTGYAGCSSYMNKTQWYPTDGKNDPPPNYTGGDLKNWQVFGIDVGRKPSPPEGVGVLPWEGSLNTKSATWEEFVRNQLRGNPKPWSNKKTWARRANYEGFNEVMLRTTTPMFLSEKNNISDELRAKYLTKAARWQCDTNGVLVFSRIIGYSERQDFRGESVLDRIPLDGNSVFEPCIREAFIELRDDYDRMCGRSSTTPIMKFSLDRAESPFQKWEDDGKACNLEELKVLLETYHELGEKAASQETMKTMEKRTSGSLGEKAPTEGPPGKASSSLKQPSGEALS